MRAPQGARSTLAAVARQGLLFIGTALVRMGTNLRRAARPESQPNSISRPDAAACASWDSVTGLPGRHKLAEILTPLRRATGPTEWVSMLAINLDRFRMVNDIHGHAAGDRVLRAVAMRLRRLIGNATELIHLGGDEFACFFAHSSDSDAPAILARRLVEGIARPIDIGEHTVELGASIGIACDQARSDAAEDLLRGACIAMARAKRDGGATVRTFEPAMDFDLRDRAELETDLRPGLRRGEIVPYYQPIISLRSGELIGFESLARWQHPRRGIIDPAIFIPIAEDIDAINDMCFALLRHACRDARDWPAHLTLSINVSPIQICDPDLSLRLLQILYAGGLAPGRLIVEITENALVDDIAAARRTITSLRNAGIKVALDDFGTGYSSLHHLRELQFDRIKIDRSFVQTLDNFAGGKVVRAIIDLGQKLGMPVTAEGIETKEQADTLASLGCAYGQGYLFGRPMPSAATQALIRNTEPAGIWHRAFG